MVPSVERKQTPVIKASNSDFLGKVFKNPVLAPEVNQPLNAALRGYKAHYLSRTDVMLPFQTHRKLDTAEISLFMQAIHGAFSEHVAFSLAPETAWYMIAHEVATHLRLNQEQYRGLFTASQEKETIEVRDDSLVYGSEHNDWLRSINLVRAPMAAKVPQATIDLMLPQFSSTTPETDTALLVLFLDMVSNYYGLEWSTACGIPEVRLEGTAADWQLVVRHAEQAQREFSGLDRYFTDLLPVLKEVAGVAAGDEPDPSFWESIYKYNHGSGGPYINGWITAFFAHTVGYRGEFNPRTDLNWRQNAEGAFSGLISADLPTHLSKIPFTWNYYDQEIPMAFMAGMMGVDFDGYLTPKLGFGVLEDLTQQS